MSLADSILREEAHLATLKFESRDDLLKSLRAFYRDKGYGISIRDSKNDSYVTLQCDRGGSSKDVKCNGGKRKRSTISRSTNCPFQITGKKGSDGFWVLTAKNVSHNHEPSSDNFRHSSFRRLTPDNVQMVKNMTLSGIPPRQIISTLRLQNPNHPANSRTIYNLKAKIRNDSLGDRSMVNALFEELQKGDFLYDVLHDHQGNITSLFIAHPLSIKLAKAFSNVFVMDCTYKTNIYNMPFLDIIGVTCFNVSFYSGFAFLEREDEQSYIWALSAFKKIVGLGNQPFVIVSDRELALINAIKNVFPIATNLLCVWHIEKNVLANCKKYFRRVEEFDKFMLSWKNVTYSTTEAVFMQNWAEFELSYNDKKDAIEYIKNIWLPWKEKFVGAWTENYLHFGSRTSSRAEEAHAKIQMCLQVSTGRLQDVKKEICLAVEHEYNETKVKLASEKMQVPNDCNMPVFGELIFRVSQFALKETYKQYQKIRSGTLTPCTGHFMATMGLPCTHKIKDLQGMTFSLDLIHPHWRIDSLSLNLEDDSHYDDDDASKFPELLNELYLKYQEWPLNKKEYATSVITKLLNQPDIFIEPVIQRPDGRPPKSKKKRGTTSTTQDPSKFELVESSRMHSSSSSSGVSQRNVEVTEDISFMHHEHGLRDLNSYLDSSTDVMSLSSDVMSLQ